MAFQPGNNYGKGRPKKGDSTREKLLALIGEATIDESIKTDFLTGNEDVRKFVYDHVYGKPVQKTENDNNNYFPENITIEIVRTKNEEAQAETLLNKV